MLEGLTHQTANLSDVYIEGMYLFASAAVGLQGRANHLPRLWLEFVVSIVEATRY